MDLLDDNLKACFDQVRYRNGADRETLMSLFNRRIHDQWPIQHRVAEYNFLRDRAPDDRNIEILKYGIQCWWDVTDCAAYLKYEKPFVCCLAFDNQDYVGLGMLWPELFFANDDLSSLSNLKTAKPTAGIGEYIQKMVLRLRLDRTPIIRQESHDNSTEIKIYLDFEPFEGETRKTLLYQ